MSDFFEFAMAFRMVTQNCTSKFRKLKRKETSWSLSAAGTETAAA